MTQFSELSLQDQEYILRAKHEWEQIFDAVADLIFVIDSDQTIIRANRAFAERCGLEITELVGRKCCKVMHGKNLPADFCLCGNSAECRVQQTVEVFIDSLQGSFEVTVSPLVNDEGQRAASVYVLRDITDKCRAEQALKVSEQRFSLFMENLPLAVFIKDYCGRFLFANQYLKDLLNVEELNGLTVNDLLPGETALKMAADDHEALTQGLGLYKDYFIDANGNEVVFDTYKFPVPCSNGTRFLGGISVDVTEKKRQEKLLAAQQQQLMEINNTLESRIIDAVNELRQKDALLIHESRLNAMGEMISNIAHQWRQPLNNIGLIIQSLQLAYKNNDLSIEELDEDINEALEVLQQISGTIDEFRCFFRHEDEPSTFVVNEIVDRSLSLAGSSLKSCVVAVEAEDQSLVTATGFPNEYAQAFLNIMLNARDALQDRRTPDPQVTVRISEENGRSVVTVRDNAGGINAAILPKIFDPYFSTRPQAKGGGVGLYMAKIIIEEHMSGRLTVQCIDGYTEFRIEV